MNSNSKDWSKIASIFVKYELNKRKMRYSDLIDRLNSIGIKETINTLTIKLSRGHFSAALLLQILYVLDTDYKSLIETLVEQISVKNYKHVRQVDIN